MPSYTPPLRDMQFVMNEVLGVTADLKAMPKYADIDTDTINAVLEEAGKFATEVALPLNISGDTEGCKIDQATHAVTTPKGFKEAYKQYIAGGWPGLSCETEFGGQGLPLVVNQCFYEMLNSANQAWTMYPWPDARRARGTGFARHRSAKTNLFAQNDQRRMDGHHVPDRAALRHRPGPDAHQG